jgi:hypothetical protein
MRGWGLRIQIGRTTIEPSLSWPRDWHITSSIMNPKLFGVGIWLTKDLWHDAE